jgi:ribokinase
MKGPRPRILVVGSFVTDLVFRVKHRPGPGETMLAEGFGMFLGGKGFNQAIGARRLGADVAIVGRVGSDPFGDMFVAKLEREGIDSGRVRRDPEAGTAIATPVVDENGQNSIIAAPRANMRVTPDDVLAADKQIASADILMLQFEIPVAASRRAAEIAQQHKTLVLLDPAPVEHGFERFNAPLDYIVPNEIEAHMLTGRATPEEAVISLGEEGALAVDRASLNRFPGHKVKVVDSTGAGDAFRAGLAVRIAEGASLEDAVRFGNACGALACTVAGAEPSMPRREVVEKLLAPGVR